MSVTMIGEEVKKVGTCWYVCSGIFVEEEVPTKISYIIHTNDSLDEVYEGNKTWRSRSSISRKNAFLRDILLLERQVKVDFKFYMKAKTLDWMDFVRGTLMSINGGYVFLTKNRCIKIIEEGQGVWKAHLNPQGVYVQLSPPWNQGRIHEGSFPAGYAVSGFSFVENAGDSQDECYEFSIKNAGETSNIRNKNLFCIKLGLKGPVAKQAVGYYLEKPDLILEKVLAKLKSELSFQQCKANLAFHERQNGTLEKKKQWSIFLETLSNAKSICIDHKKEME